LAFILIGHCIGSDRDAERMGDVVVRDAANISHHTSAISHLLKWIFWILVAGIVLIIVVKFFGRRSLL